jgi:hypothetical protein
MLLWYTPANLSKRFFSFIGEKMVAKHKNENKK